MNRPTMRPAPNQPGVSLRWDTPWAWPLSHQVSALTALVLVLLMACVASLMPWWVTLEALQQSHQSLSAQYAAHQQTLSDVPDLEQRVQALRNAHERRSSQGASVTVGWLHPVSWAPVPSPAAASAGPRWRGQTQGQASEVAAVLAQLAGADKALQVELLRSNQAGQWRLTWEVWGDAPPAGGPSRPHLARDWLALLDDAPMHAHWHAQLTAQPGRVQWLLPQLKRRAEPLEAFDLDQLAWMGWLQQGDRRVALVQVGTGVHRVAVGEHLGRHHGRVEQIAADHLVLREVVRSPLGVWAPVITRWPAPGPMVPKGAAPSTQAKDPS